jgi:four helix bundle protein
VQSFTELDAWQLANELTLGVYDLIRADKVQRDVDFVRQIRNAAASAPRNIAEGFGRYQPREFGQDLQVANGSLLEASNHLQDGVDRGYFTPEQIEPLLVLARRASAATTALARYLRTALAPNARTRTNQGAPPLDIPAEPLGWLPVSLAALRAARTAMRVATGTKFSQRAA